MALSLSSLHTRLAVRPGAQRTRPVVIVRSNIGEDALKNFAKPDDKNVPWPSTGTGFGKGKISHHGAGKPFKDGYIAGGQKKKEPSPEVASSEEQPQEGEDYVGEAVQNLVAHNFTGDGTEPPESTGSAGWKGDIHDRKSDGFHARKV